MKTLAPLLLGLGILGVSGGNGVHAADRSEPLRKGKVLILKNEYVIEGDIERIGDRYCVRRKVGETWVPAERVLALTASMQDAYTYLRGRINLDDPDERLHLARWCRNNGLLPQALAELQAAAELRPSHAETRRLLRYWQQTAARGIRPASHEEPIASAPASPSAAVEPPPIEVTAESLGLFATRVQPILMNTCARCHATGKGGSFHLTQVFGDGISSRRTLERNLAAVLAEIDINQPEASPLLLKAVSDHAHIGQAPLRDRQAAPYRTLENWVKLTVAGNPHLRNSTTPAQNTTTTDAAQNKDTKAPVRTPFGTSRAKDDEESQWGVEAPRHAKPLPSPVVPSENYKKDPQNMYSHGSAATPVDPYDPEPFNRNLHPEAGK